MRDDILGRVRTQGNVSSGVEAFSPSSYQSYDGYIENIDAPDRVPDDYWVVSNLWKIVLVQNEIQILNSLFEATGKQITSRFTRKRSKSAICSTS
jgi:hypothetical protein